MAKMYPKKLDARLHNEAEIYVWGRLGESLSDEYSVYTLPFSYPDRKTGAMRSGEIDCLIVHPEDGALILEVKGHRKHQIDLQNGDIRVEYNSTKSSVIGQVWGQRSGLVRQLDVLNVDRSLYWIGTAIAFPYSAPFRRSSDLSYPQNQIYFERDIKTDGFGSRIADSIRSQRASHEGMTPEISDRIHQLITEDNGRTYNSKLGYLLPAIALEQDRISDELKEQAAANKGVHKLAVSGSAGTGKTLFAVEQARWLADNGRSVQFVCFGIHEQNALVSKEFERVDHIQIDTGHHLAERLVEFFRDELSDAPTLHESSTNEEVNAYWEEIMRLFVEERLAERYPLKVDAVVVDEAQDYSKEWLEQLSFLNRSREEDYFWICYDRSQASFETGFDVPDVIRDEDYSSITLDINWRNTRKIHEFAKRFHPNIAHRDLLTHPHADEGEDIRWSPTDEMLKELKHRVRHLVKEQGLKPENITIISGKSVRRGKSLLSDIVEIDGIPLSHEELGNEGSIIVSSIAKFKGLENTAVIMVELEDAFRRDPTNIYRAATRAKAYLAIVESPAVINALQEYGKESSV